MLAIVIPYYKINFFDETLKSLSNQTNKAFKVYIGDDASPENPSELLKEYEDKVDFVYQKFDKNLGGTSLTKQWERCIKLTQNEDWIIILGDDDVLSENFVESFYAQKEFFKDSYHVIRFSVIKIDNNSKPISEKFLNEEIESSKDILFNNKRSSLSEYVFSKVKINEIGFKDFPLAWWSDVLAVLEFSDFGKIYSINEAFVNVRISDVSISGSKTLEKQKGVASFIFYNYLLSNKKSYFNDNEREIILEKVSKLYINHKKNSKLFYEISVIYLKNGKFILYARFINKIIKSIFK